MKSYKTIFATAALLVSMQAAWAFSPGGALGGGGKSAQAHPAQESHLATEPVAAQGPSALPADQLESSAEAPILHENPGTQPEAVVMGTDATVGKQPSAMSDAEYAEAMQLHNDTKAQRHQLKDALRKYRQATKDRDNMPSGDDMLVLCVILALFIPPLAVYLWEGSIGTNFWISLILTLLFFVPGVIFSLIVILTT